MLTVSVIVLCLTFIIVTQQRIIYLLPQSSQTVSQCPIERCYTFGDLDIIYPWPPDYNIETAIVLLPGVHVNNETVLFSHAMNFSLISANSSVGTTIIQCHGNAGFTFEYVHGLLISGIEFRDCESFIQNSNITLQIHYSLFIFQSSAIELRNITVKHGQSIGLAVAHVYGDFSIKGCRFLSSDSEHFSLYMYIEERELHYINITVIDSQLQAGLPLQSYDPGLVKLSMNQEGTEYFIKILIKNVATDNRSGGMKFILCGAAVLFNIPDNLAFEKNIHTCSCECEVPTIITVKDAAFRHTFLMLNSADISVILSNASFHNTSLYTTYDFHMILHNTTFQDNSSLTTSLVNSTIQGLFLYQRNTVGIGLRTNLIIDESAHVIIADNYIPHGDAPFTIFYATVIVLQNSTIVFKNNTGKMSGGLLLHTKSSVNFRGPSSTTFENNSGSRGGALALYGLSTLIFDGPCNLNFIQNHASITGGAVFVQDDDYLLYISPTESGYSPFLESEHCSESEQVNFKFSDNTAVQAGNAMYGGWISNDSACFSFEFDRQKIGDLSLVSSNPTRVCICNENSKSDCHISQIAINVFPGQIFEIEAVAVGQMFGIVPSFVQAEFVGEGNGELERINRVQSTKQTCTKLKFVLRSSSEVISINLTTNRQMIPFSALKYHWLTIPNIELLYTQLQIQVNLSKCPTGFFFNNATKSCDCRQALIEYNIQCDANTFILRKNSPSQWISTTTQHLQSGQDLGIIIHNHCPFDYCLPTKFINLTFPDQQCAFNRSGILCGACESNLSQVLGTSNCKECSSAWIALIIPLTALAGVALVLGLMFLNLTVSAGTINGLIFYANVVRANHAIFFPHHASKSFLSVFIAWLNLDLGIEVCFYHEFNAYAKTWLQFMLPSYICFIMAVIIIITKYSLKASKLLGSNCVQVLATLFLLSYSKLLCNIITVFSSTVLVYPDRFPRRVWLYDGNVDYLAGKHIPLFITAMLFLIFISIPYTMALLCFQYLQKVSDLKLFFWVKELYPLFDAYVGPYKGKHRYWTGLLLLARAGLFVVYSVNTTHNPTVDLLTNVIATSVLLAYLAVCGGVYKHWLLELIESSFILNICILSAGTLYYLQNGGDKSVLITYISAGITFTIFVAIIFYHIINVSLGYWKKFHKGAPNAEDGVDDHDTDQSSCRLSQLNQSEEVTYSVVELRDPLLTNS